MLLLFRFLLIMFVSRFRSKIGVLEPSTVRFTVMPWDCDLNIHLNAGRFISFMDIARIELMGRMRIFSKVLDRGWRPINGGMVIRYRRSLLPFQRFDLTTRIVGWDEKWYYMEQIIERDGALCALAYARLLIRGKGRNIPTPEMNAITDYGDQPSPPLPEFVARWREMENLR